MTRSRGCGAVHRAGHRRHPGAAWIGSEPNETRRALAAPLVGRSGRQAMPRLGISRRRRAMDADRFDAVSKVIAAVIPRRGALRVVLGVGSVSLVAWLAGDDAAAKKRRRRKNKKKKKPGCVGATKQVCGATCVDLATDSANCGECGFVCESGECVNGACTCDAGQFECLSGCACADRIGGGKVCFKGGNNGIDGDGDDDCPFRSLCFSINKCSVPCVE